MPATYKQGKLCNSRSLKPWPGRHTQITVRLGIQQFNNNNVPRVLPIPQIILQDKNKSIVSLESHYNMCKIKVQKYHGKHIAPQVAIRETQFQMFNETPTEGTRHNLCSQHYGELSSARDLPG